MSIIKIQKDQIAPCGANCVTCMGFLKTENSCPGCRKGDENKPKNCISCRIKNCIELIAGNFIFCYECTKFPCARIKHLDNRYKKNYAFSMIENLKNIQKDGLETFIDGEEKRWICNECGGIISVHRGYCGDCGKIFYTHSGTNRAPIK